MIRFFFGFGHLTDDNDCPECSAVLAELENIDDEADKFGELTLIQCNKNHVYHWQILLIKK